MTENELYACNNLLHTCLQMNAVEHYNAHNTVILCVCKYLGAHEHVFSRECVAALNSQSSLGFDPGAPAAVGSLGAASLALSSPLYPAGPSLLAAGPHRTSN